MDFLDEFRLWRDNSEFDEKTRLELTKLSEEKDKKEIEDRFYKQIEFGTAGLRSMMGAGKNRINKYTLSRVTAGYSLYLKEKYIDVGLRTRGIVVCFDTRNNSYEYAQTVSKVFSSYGIFVRLFDSPRPVPELSYAIRRFKAVGGVMITASHNTKEYNGYKVYNETGCQLDVKESILVTDYINKVTDYNLSNYIENADLIEKFDITNEFTDEILKFSKITDKKIKSNFKIVYTPLYGTGFVPVTQVLKKDGFSSLFVLDEQKEPDGNFPTVFSPNPGDKHSLELAILYGKKIGADLIIGTDPDSDRLGMAVLDGENYKFLTGNQIGAILTDFILSSTDFNIVKKPVIIKSIVSSNLAKKIAEKYGVQVFETLTGFRFIGKLIQEFEMAKCENNYEKNYNFLLGFEESYGFLTHTLVREKDAVCSAMMICEYGAKLKSEGKTFVSRLNEFYAEFGYYYDEQENIILQGKDNFEKMMTIMKNLRENETLFVGIAEKIDYLKGVKDKNSFFDLSPSNVIVYKFNDGSFIAVRPSGTEPKIKFYYSIIGKNESEAEEKKSKYKSLLKAAINN